VGVAGSLSALRPVPGEESMIQITTVQGDVLVEDAKKGYTEMARGGMTLDAMGNYLIATTATSRVDITVNGEVVKLGPSSFLRIRGDQTWWERHTEYWARDVKKFLGRIWVRVARDRPDLGPGGGGVRG